MKHSLCTSCLEVEIKTPVVSGLCEVCELLPKAPTVVTGQLRRSYPPGWTVNHYLNCLDGPKGERVTMEEWENSHEYVWWNRK
jgi:hypothetical protein